MLYFLTKYEIDVFSSEGCEKFILTARAIDVLNVT
jgi:hypothetical protein